MARRSRKQLLGPGLTMLSHGTPRQLVSLQSYGKRLPTIPEWKQSHFIRADCILEFLEVIGSPTSNVAKLHRRFFLHLLIAAWVVYNSASCYVSLHGGFDPGLCCELNVRYHISGNIRTEFGQGALLIVIRAYAAAERQDCPRGVQWQSPLQ